MIYICFIFSFTTTSFGESGKLHVHWFHANHRPKFIHLYPKPFAAEVRRDRAHQSIVVLLGHAVQDNTRTPRKCAMSFALSLPGYDQLRLEIRLFNQPLVRDAALDELILDVRGAHILHLILILFHRSLRHLPCRLLILFCGGRLLLRGCRSGRLLHVRDAALDELILDVRGAHILHLLLILVHRSLRHLLCRLLILFCGGRLLHRGCRSGRRRMILLLPCWSFFFHPIDVNMIIFN